MGFYSSSRYGGYRGSFGAFGDVAEAQAALDAAQSKLASLQTERKKQLQLIAFTQQALKNCMDGDALTIVGNIVSGGAVAAVCVAEQNTALGQRKAQLGQIDLQITSAKGDVAAAQLAYSQARSNAQSMPAADPANVGADPAGGSVGYRAEGAAQLVGGGGGIGDLLTNPLVLAGGAVVLLGGAFLAFRKKG